MTQEANFETFLCFPNSAFNIRKVTKFLAEKLSISEVISQKPEWGCGKHPPPPTTTTSASDDNFIAIDPIKNFGARFSFSDFHRQKFS